MTTNIDLAAEIIDRLRLDSGPGDISTAEHIARALADAGLLATDPQIIRTFEEIMALSPDTVMIDSESEAVMPHDYIGPDGEAVGMFINDLPAVAVATGGQVRAARKALEEA